MQEIRRKMSRTREVDIDHCFKTSDCEFVRAVTFGGIYEALHRHSLIGIVIDRLRVPGRLPVRDGRDVCASDLHRGLLWHPLVDRRSSRGECVGDAVSKALHTRDPIVNGRSSSESALALLKAVAAIDHQQGAVDVARTFRCQEHHRCGNLVRSPGPRRWRVQGSLPLHCARRARFDPAGATALAVMPLLATSSASVRVRPTMPALAAE